MTDHEWVTERLPDGPPMDDWTILPTVHQVRTSWWSITMIRRAGRFSGGQIRRMVRDNAERIRRPFHRKRHRRMAGK